MNQELEWSNRADDGDGQFAIAVALCRVARAIQNLGTADAATPMGAIEAHGVFLKEEVVPQMADAMRAIAEAIENNK